MKKQKSVMNFFGSIIPGKFVRTPVEITLLVVAILTTMCGISCIFDKEICGICLKAAANLWLIIIFMSLWNIVISRRNNDPDS
jgi:hypothetical protein